MPLSDVPELEYADLSDYSDLVPGPSYQED